MARRQPSTSRAASRMLRTAVPSSRRMEPLAPPVLLTLRQQGAGRAAGFRSYAHAALGRHEVPVEIDVGNPPASEAFTAASGAHHQRSPSAHRSYVPASWNAKRSRAPSTVCTAGLGLPGWPMPGVGGVPGPAAADPPVMTAHAVSLTR